MLGSKSVIAITKSAKSGFLTSPRSALLHSQRSRAPGRCSTFTIRLPKIVGSPQGHRIGTLFAAPAQVSNWHERDLQACPPQRPLTLARPDLICSLRLTPREHRRRSGGAVTGVAIVCGKLGLTMFRRPR
jgi:hypothetical protein